MSISYRLSRDTGHIVKGVVGLVTTAPAAMTLPVAILTPGKMTHRAAIQKSSSITVSWNS